MLKKRKTQARVQKETIKQMKKQFHAKKSYPHYLAQLLL